LKQNPEANVNTLIAIPYNPYEPKPYRRWTMKGMLDLDHELKVAAEFWNFLGGENSYSDLLDCFERIGLELKDEINRRFAKFNDIAK
jgi:type II restriction enzyme